MGDAGRTDRISALLHEVAETHHTVYRIVDGYDPDWASWYAKWLINLSELPDLLGARPVRSELIYMLVALDREFVSTAPGGTWEDHYARRLLEHFAGSGNSSAQAFLGPGASLTT